MPNDVFFLGYGISVGKQLISAAVVAVYMGWNTACWIHMSCHERNSCDTVWL